MAAKNFCSNKHKHCAHTAEQHEAMGWTCDFWPVGGACCEALPEIGMGATLQIGSDRLPLTIVKISKSGAVIEAQYDSFERLDFNGQSEDQRWQCTPNPLAGKERLHRSRDGRYYLKGAHRVYIGNRSAYRDPHF